MPSLSPHEIRHLRREMGWSVEEFAQFFHRSRQTIYNWENGDTRPGGAIRAVLTALRTELRSRTENRCAEELKKWKGQLAEQDAVLFLEAIQAHPPRTEEIYADLIRRSEEEGGCMIGGAPETTSAFVIPLTAKGLRAFVDRLLGSKTLSLSPAVIHTLIERIVPSSSPAGNYPAE